MQTVPTFAGHLPTHLSMTVPLWGLVIFILWTIAVVALLLTVRIRHLAAGGSPKDFAVINDESLLWRLFRVQSNLIENLPLYLGVVFLLLVRGVSGAVVDGFVGVYISFRLFHSIVHIAGANPVLRLVSLVIQLSCLVSLTFLAIFQSPLG
ncbi:MAPEG family protein (plasmid) [Kovacikia minuta CCNUW1]|uniref:MAPEG family protein n=1 Tax=Kovacikia minuta TaxID=2931930 RepID=UPI001CCFECE4|nr:MAPEG family protein [Kovacikia minuta]UBF30486.1 MAPEG family protein [Kovacikia minuta CCNUW1]